MVSRISDARVPGDDPVLALIVDLLRPCTITEDLYFMFPHLARASATTWRVPVDATRALLFEFVEEFGAINIRLE